MCTLALVLAFPQPLLAAGKKKKKKKPGSERPAHVLSLACQQALADLVHKGPGGKLIFADDYKTVVIRFQHEQREIRHGNTFQCPHCRGLNPTQGNADDTLTCIECGQKFEAPAEINDLRDQDGRLLIHLDSILTRDSGAGRPIEAPWKCAYCNKTNPDDEATCENCGQDKKEGFRRVFSWGPDLIIHRQAIRPTSEVISDSGSESTPNDSLGDFSPPPKKISAAGEFETEEPAPTKRGLELPVNLNRLSRRQVLTALGLIATTGVGIAWVASNDTPDAEIPSSGKAKIAKRTWQRKVLVRVRGAEGQWNELPDALIREGSEENPEWPNVPSAYIGSKDYTVDYRELYTLQIDQGGTLKTLAVGPAEFRNWRADDKVELKVIEGGVIVSLRRIP